MIKSVLSAFGSFVFSALDFLLFLAILLFVGLLVFIFWPILKWPLLAFLIGAITFFCYLIYKIKEKPKPLEQDETLWLGRTRITAPYHSTDFTKTRGK